MNRPSPPKGPVQVKLTVPRARYERLVQLCIAEQLIRGRPMSLPEYILTQLQQKEAQPHADE